MTFDIYLFIYLLIKTSPSFKKEDKTTFRISYNYRACDSIHYEYETLKAY